MERYDSLYDVTESAQVRFWGWVSEHSRYDFGIVYTSRFFGKPLVICMQTGLSALLGSDDANRPGYLQKAFRLRDEREAEELARMFLEILPALQLAENQY